MAATLPTPLRLASLETLRLLSTTDMSCVYKPRLPKYMSRSTGRKVEFPAIQDRAKFPVHFLALFRHLS